MHGYLLGVGDATRIAPVVHRQAACGWPRAAGIRQRGGSSVPGRPPIVIPQPARDGPPEARSERGSLGLGSPPMPVLLPLTVALGRHQ
jgi:hypothetical protein